MADLSSNTKDESYWIGVRDALRMVDSFLRWSRRNPTIAKTLDEFLAEGLVAAAKRCESCLGRELGLKYGKEDPEKGLDESAIRDDAETIEGAETSQPPFEEPMQPAHEVTSEVESDVPLSEDSATEMGTLIDALTSEGFSDVTEHVSEITEETAEEGTTESVSIEHIEPDSLVSPTSIDDFDFEEEIREFTSDFELTEPEPLVIDAEEADSTSGEEESIPEVMPPPEEEYSFETTPPAEDIEEEMSSSTKSELTAPPIREIWSPYDEPAISEEERVTDDEDAESGATADLVEEDEVEKAEPPAKRAPPPPPPPETDESEEERQKRARRLFFGT